MFLTNPSYLLSHRVDPHAGATGQEELQLNRRRIRAQLELWLGNELPAIRRCFDRLLEKLPRKCLAENKVLVMYGGGKDSSFVVALARLFQLSALEEKSTTFSLRVARDYFTTV